MGSNLDISASEADLQNIFTRSNRFTVPDYQRLYSWKESQWEEFWNDLTSLDEEDTHFLGSIVVIQHQKKYDELDELELVDGQQRITTISLLLRVMREYYGAHSETGLSEQIDTNYLHETDFDNDRYPKLSLSRFEDADYQKILDSDPEGVNEESQLRQAYEYFHERVFECEIEEVDQLRKRLLGSMTLVVVECDSAASAFRLFETLNNRGLELSAVDLMKNALLQVASERYGGTDEETYEHIRAQWERVLENVVYEINNPDRFFRHYMMSRADPDIEGSITSRTLYDTFRDLLDNRLPTDETTLVEYVDGMVETSELYVGLTKADVDVFSGRPQKRINRRLRNLNDIQSSHSRTLLLRTLKEFDEYDDVLSVLRLLEVFMVRWRVSGNQTGSKLDRIFSELCSDAFDTTDPVKTIQMRLAEEAPGNDEFRSRLANSDFSRNAQTKYLLDTIERRHYMESGEGKDYDRATVDIEHIAPQQAFSAKKYSTWRDVLGVGKAEFNQYRNRLGNLTLLEERLNETAKDNPFEQKKDQYKLSDFQMTQEIRERYDRWTVEEIEDRSEHLAEIGVEIWDFDRYV
ncbi:DUF262 domain-containing HNH endonuclease family protein [Halobacterium salinarum]|uniref:DUF262 domain-containing protein n=1 Tax=Halobacterium salinarum TaxID=2242 RepID=UPI002553CC0F|nr:DUF262 domain-containing HNH endonuclease family protein [Halobacterium salinarum]MDL0118309.1 DUF262 domain-containing HNH endonuclease family protein [Halobacterium salinarum]MDL0119759.1 DUF262 domain-containing HNH endonuclease family protein [Halobacterium salinarum]